MSKLRDRYKESFTDGEEGGRRASRRTRTRGVHAVLSSLTFLPVPPSFVCGFAMTYPKQTTRKRGKRSGAAVGPRGGGEERGKSARWRKREKEKRVSERGESRGRRGTEREDGGEPRSRPHTAERGCNTRMAKSRALLVQEKEGCARGTGRGTRNGVYSSCFFLSFVDSARARARAPLQPRRECSALLSTIRLHSQGRPRGRKR